MNYVTWLPISTNGKSERFDSIFVIVDWLIKIIYYKQVKVIINTPNIAKVIINILLKLHGLPNSIVNT